MSHDNNHNNISTHDDTAIDALARHAGAELRRPAPDGFADGVRRTRQRQKAVRAGVAGAGLTAIIAIGAISFTRGDDTDSVVPATDGPTVTQAPTTEVPTTGSPTSVPPTSDPSVAGPTIPPIGNDADGIPDGVYAPADDGFTLQDVFDPISFELRETIPASFIPQEPGSGGLSASGGVVYTYPGVDAERDACNQTRTADWVGGADPSGLPEWVTHLVISADGRVGVAISANCPTDGATADDGGPAGSYDVTVVTFDPDQPDQATQTVITVDGADEAAGIDSLELSDDGSYLLVTTTPRPFTEGNARQIRIVDTATGEVVAAIGEEQSGDLPRTDCGLGFVAMDFVGSTSIAYAAICPDGLAVVIHDLATGESLEVLNAEYAGRTYETMTSTAFAVDRATYTGPSSAWFILCADLESNSCWIGHGDEAMRQLPTSTALPIAGFAPYS